jgi:microcystin-dependent protein
MSQPYIAEIKMFSFDFPPRGWAQCNGQLLPIAQNQALFSLLGTTYGGNGQTTFALPDLRGRTPLHWGNGPGLPSVSLGQVGGEENHTLSISETPAHIHSINGSSNAPSATSPTGAYLSTFATDNVYTPGASGNGAMNPSAVANAGASQPHNNLQPYSVVNFCIALQGIFPSRN